MDKAYTGEQAVSMLGKGAILEVTEYKDNGANRFIIGKYGENAVNNIACYVKVIKKGAGFDFCQYGALYKVPGTANPVQYRYFCWAGGAQNCGPLHSYDYEETTVSANVASCYLNDISKLGSTDSADYTLTLAYTTNGKQELVTLDPGSFTVEKLSANKIRVTTKAETGDVITATYNIPDAIVFDKNDAQKPGCASYPANMLGVQTAWAGENVTLQGGSRTGYTLQGYGKNGSNSVSYYADQVVTMPSGGLRLKAIWKDTAAPKVTVKAVSLPTRTPISEIQDAIFAALTITDNEPVSECYAVYPTITVDETKIGQTINYPITVKDRAGNATQVTVAVTYVPGPVEIRYGKFTPSESGEASGSLTATLWEPGAERITESGFVWGIMQDPTLSVCNGKQATATAVTQPDGEIKIENIEIVKGVNYYGRAYVKAGGVTYYSPQFLIGIGAPQYGTVTVSDASVSGKTATFTVNRTGGTEGDQTVYYRTLNGSAVAGTHFTHAAGSVTIPAGSSSATFSVTLGDVTAKYDKKTSTQYSNADRVFLAEIYRVDGGAILGSDTMGECTMTKDSSYTVDRAVYDTAIVSGVTNEVKVTAADGFEKISVFNIGSNMAYKSGKQQAYLESMGLKLRYRVEFEAKEQDKGYQSIEIVRGKDAASDSHANVEGGKITEFNPDGIVEYIAMFEHAKTSLGTSYYTYTFPKICNTNSTLTDHRYAEGYTGTENYLVFDLSETDITLAADASGGSGDDWYIKDVKHTAWIPDSTEPRLLGVGTTNTKNDNKFRYGDTFTISLIFNEIVDETNTHSTNLNTMKVQTSWGEATYSGGANTNVLYFTGTVQKSASGNLQLTGGDLSKLRDMCDTEGTTDTVSTSNTGGLVDTRYPNVVLTANGVSGGAGSGTVKVLADQAHTDEIKYAWSDSTVMPVTGWVTLTSGELTEAKSASGFTAYTRQQPGSGNNGKWYLHLLSTCNDNKATDHQYVTVDFGTPAAPKDPKPIPTVSATVNNTNWAKSRQISWSLTNLNSISQFAYRYEADSNWTTLFKAASGNITANKNGKYIFRIIDGDDNVYLAEAVVEKLDLTAPTATIGELDKTASTMSRKEGVYHSVSIPVSFGDSESGLVRYHYRFTDSAAAPYGSWGAAQTASGTVTVSKSLTGNGGAALKDQYLHLLVIDGVGNETIISSGPYRMISQAAASDLVPTITLTYDAAAGISVWTNDAPTIQWSLNQYAGKNFTVTLPDGSTTTEASGAYLATENTTYTFTVVDNDFGGVDTRSVTYSKLDFSPPVVTFSNIPNDYTVKPTVTLHSSDTQSGFKIGKYWIVQDTTLKPGGDPEGTFDKAGQNPITLSSENYGTYYIYYEVEDKAGGETGSGYRPGNIASGFSPAIKVTAPHSHVWEYTVNGATITAACKGVGYGGCDSTDNKTITVIAPAKTVYHDGKSEQATLSADTLVGIQNISVTYFTMGEGGKLGDRLTAAPTTPGHYIAVLTAVDVGSKGHIAQVEYEIDKATPTADDFTFTPPSDLIYNGQEKAWKLVVRDGVEGMGSIGVVYTNGEPEDRPPTEAGTYTFTLDVGEGEYYKAATELTDASWKFTVTQAANVWTTEPSIQGWTYGDPANEPGAAAAKFGDVYYSYLDANGDPLSGKPQNAGKYTLRATVDATDNYAGLQKDVEFTIQPKQIESGDFELKQVSYVYNGSAFEPGINIINTLFTANDYDVQYQNNIDAGENTATVILTGKNNATGQLTYDFTIGKAEVVYSRFEMEGKTYDRTPVNGLQVAVNSDGSYTIEYVGRNGTEYKSTTPPTDAGEYTVNFSIEEAPNYKSSSNSEDFTIGKATPTAEMFTFTKPSGDLIYDGEEHHATITVKDEYKDGMGSIGYYWYRVGPNAFAPNPIKARTYQLEIQELKEGKNYFGAIDLTDASWKFTVTQAANAWTVTPSIEGGNTWEYHSGVKTLVSQAKFGDDTTEVTYWNADRTESSTDQPTEAGTYWVAWVVPDTTDYQALNHVMEFTITPMDLETKFADKDADDLFSFSEGGQSGLEHIVYNGNAFEPDAAVKQILTELGLDDSDFTVTYSDNTKAGEATITITGKNNASGTFTKKFTIQKAPGEINNFNQPGKTYDREAVADATYDLVTDPGVTATVEYKKTADPDTAYTTVKPVNAGEYTLRVTLPESDNYLGKTLTDTFTVERATPTAEMFTFTKPSGDLIYDGEEHHATVTVKDEYKDGMGNITEISYQTDKGSTRWPIWAAEYRAKINLNGGQNYLGTSTSTLSDESWTFTVEQKELGIVWSAPQNLEFNGEDKIPAAALTGVVGEDKVTPVIAPDNGDNKNVTDAGFTYRVTELSGTHAVNYKLPQQVVSDPYIINPRPLQKEDFSYSATGYTYSKTEIQPEVTSVQALVKANDFDVAYSDNIKAGENTAKITLTGKNNASGSVELLFTIDKRTLALEWTAPADLIYTSSVKTPSVEATNVCAGDDVRFDIARCSGDDVHVGDFTYHVVSIVGDDQNYILPSDTESDTYTITPRKLILNWTANPQTYIYNAESHVIPVAVDNAQGEDAVTVSTRLTAGMDDCNVGDFTYEAYEIGGDKAANYVLPQHVTSPVYEIYPRELTPGDFDYLGQACYIYNGEAFTPGIVPTAAAEKFFSSIAPDYDVTYEDNIFAGTATITVTARNNGERTGEGNAKGEFRINFVIDPVPLTAEMFVIEDDEFYYTANPIEPKVAATAAWQNYLLRDRDYTVHYEDNVYTGQNTAKIVFEGKGNATGRVVIPFTIVYPPVDLKYRLELFATTEGEFFDVAYYARAARPGDVVTLKVSTTALGDEYNMDYRKLSVKYEVIGAVQLGGNYDYNGHPIYKDGIATDFMLSEGFNKIVAKVYYAGTYVGEFEPFFTLVQAQ